MKSFVNILMMLFPFVWMILAIINAFAGHYDRAAYDVAAGTFFMVLPMYFDFLDKKYND